MRSPDLTMPKTGTDDKELPTIECAPFTVAEDKK